MGQDTAKIQVRHASKIFGREEKAALELLDAGKSKAEVQKKTGVVVGVHDISLEIFAGEIFVIMGLSGSGKSTLLRLINRLHEPSRGSVLVDGKEVTKMKAAELRALRRRAFGMVFQNFGLLPQRTVLGNVEFGLEIQGLPRSQRRERAQEVIETVGLQGYEQRYVAELSGGMQQRVGLARALAADPEILLMDEAFSALDPIIRSQLQDDLLEIQDRLNKTIVFVSHDLDEALKLGNRIAILRDARLIQVGGPQEILSRPADEYVSTFVEGADRSKVLTAREVMQNVRAAANPKDSPRVVLRKMERSGFGGLLVIDNGRRLHGYVDLQSVRDCREQEQLPRDRFRPIPTAEVDAKLVDLIQIITDQGSPVAVIDGRQRVIGVVDKSTILAALAQNEDNPTGEEERPPSTPEAGEAVLGIQAEDPAH
ncbi:quaternary amine ABC transporter ATP-binding protein [Acidithiobacillus caldus]